MPIKCFNKISSPELKEKFQTQITEGMSDEQQREIGTQIAMDYHEQLHNELNEFKKSIGVKDDAYVKPDNSQKIKEVNDLHDKLIEDQKAKKSEETVSDKSAGKKPRIRVVVGKSYNKAEIEKMSESERKKAIDSLIYGAEAHGIVDEILGTVPPIESGTTVEGLLNHIIEHNAGLGELAKKVLEKIDADGRKTKVVVNNDVEYAVYRGDQIEVNKKWSNNAYLLLHEIIHAGTSTKLHYEINNVDKGVGYLNALNDYLKNGKNENIKEIIRIYLDTAKRKGFYDELFNGTKGEKYLANSSAVDNSINSRYAYINIQEFVAEALSKKDFRNYLKSQRYEGSKSFLDRLISAVKQLFGLPVKDNLFDKVMQASYEILSEERPSNANTTWEDSGKADIMAIIDRMRDAGFNNEEIKKELAERNINYSDEDFGDIAAPASPSSAEENNRSFSKQVLADENILPEVKTEIQKKVKYARQTNAMSVQEASDIINLVGEEQAYELVVHDKNMYPAVRNVMGQILIKKFNDLAAGATNKADRDFYIDKTISVANFVAEKLGTEAGQMIQAFSLFSRLTPEAQLRNAINEEKEIGEKQKRKAKKQTTKLGNDLKQANKDAAQEAVENKLPPKIEKTETERQKKAKDKIQAAREKRDKIIQKRKNDKGDKPLFSSIGGLTPEGIEFVGNLAATYIQEGIATLELITDKILQDLKSVSKKAPDQSVIDHVKEIVAPLHEKSVNKKLASSIKELESKIREIVAKHYTVDEKTKGSLIDKLVQDTGLTKEEATELAKEIQDEFEQIATRKKRQILEKEKKRFDNIKKKLKGTNDPKTIDEDVIKFTNLGAFDNEELLDMLANKFGTGTLTPEQGKKITELAEKIQKAPEGSPKNDATQDLLKYLAQIKGSKWGEILQSIWYANVLSGYGTHVKNIVSTFFNGMAFAASEAARDPRSIPVLFVGGAKGVKRGLSEAWHTVSTGRSPIHIKQVETPQTLERIRFKGGYFNPYNYLKFVGRLMQAEDVLQFQALKEMRATQLAYREAKRLGLKNPFSKEAWNVINEKLLNTKERYDEAELQADDEGLTGKEKSRRIYELMEQSRPIEMTEDAYGFAAKGTFNHESEGTLGALTNAVARVLDFPIGSVRPLRFVIPFTRIITNVVNNWMDFSPLGLIRAARGVRGFESFEQGYGKGAYHVMTKEERSQTIAKASLGIALTLGLYALTKIKGDDGEPILEITGGGTGDYKRDMQLKQEGWQPYSIKVGNSYYSYALTPLMFNLGIVGNINDHEKYGNGDNEDLLDKTTLAVYQSAKLISDGTWIGSTATLMSSLASDNPTAMEKGISSTLSNAAKGFIVPNAYTQSAQKTEDIFRIPQKDTHSFLDRLIQDVPIARNSLNDKINALGDPIVRDIDIMVSKETTDPVWKFIMDKKIWISPVNKNSVIVLDRNTKQERAVTEDEYYKFSKIRGQRIKEALTQIMRVKPNITTEQLEKVLKRVKAAATKRAKNVISLDIREDED